MISRGRSAATLLRPIGRPAPPRDRRRLPTSSRRPAESPPAKRPLLMSAAGSTSPAGLMPALRNWVRPSPESQSIPVAPYDERQGAGSPEPMPAVGRVFGRYGAAIAQTSDPKPRLPIVVACKPRRWLVTKPYAP